MDGSLPSNYAIGSNYELLLLLATASFVLYFRCSTLYRILQLSYIPVIYLHSFHSCLVAVPPLYPARSIYLPSVGTPRGSSYQSDDALIGLPHFHSVVTEPCHQQIF